MDPQLLKTAGAVLGVIVACPIVYACLKAAVLFGAMKTTVEGLASSVDGLQRTLTQFTEKVTEDLGGHGTRLSVAETKIESLETRHRAGPMYDRRAAQ